MDRPNLGSIPGNDVLSGDPWGLQQDGIGLAFSQPSETAGPLVVGKNLDAFSVGQMPQLPWLFTGDPESQCIDFVGTSVPQTTNQVVRENTTAIPANLTDADIVAAGAANNWPGAFGVAEVFGPVLSFSYSETFDAQARFTIADGEHRLSFVISIEVGARQSVKVAKLRVTGTHPNRVGVFSISNPEGGGFPTDNYSLTFDWRWNSIPRPTTYYTDNQTQTETMAETSVFAGKGWTASGERFGYSGAGPVVPGAPANGTVTLPTFSNITWRRFG